MITTPLLREIAQNLFLQSLMDCSVEEAFSRKVKRCSGESGNLLIIGDEVIDLDPIRRIRIVAMGKAAPAMLEALLPFLRDLPRSDISGVLIANQQPAHLPVGFQFFAGSHPTPNQASIEGARAALGLVRSAREEGGTHHDSLCLFLISGGASAMMELPLDPAISLEDTVSFHRELVHSGGSIAEINCVRKHFSRVKGGRLALEADGLMSYSLLVSDVPLDSLDSLASGPTLPDTSTVAQCKEILARYGLLERFPASVQRFFSSEQLIETPKAWQLEARALTLLSANDLSEVARQRAENLRFYAIVDNTCDDWDYRAAAEYLLDRLRTLRRVHSRVCLISVGEIGVELPGPAVSMNGADGSGKPGDGGRNQHFALYAATLLKPSDASTAILSGGTDGIDGNSIAAGAIVDEKTLAEHESHWEKALSALTSFDSGSFLRDLDLRVVIGATGNNLRDLRILLSAEPL